MDINVPTIDEMAAGIRRGVAAAIKDAHRRGLPAFVSDDKLIYAIYRMGDVSPWNGCLTSKPIDQAARADGVRRV